MGNSNIEMSDLLQLCVDEGASDLHIRVNVPPMLRIHGSLVPIDLPALDGEDTERLMKSIASPASQQSLREIGGADFGFGFGDKARFRVSVFRERGNVGVVLRQIPKTLLTLNQIGLPEQVNELLFRPRGLVLVTGPTGSGKTTTLASMLNIINEQRDCHIITIEDPIEYYHPHKKSVVTQREIGADVPSFAEAIRRALRQDPDVILVGEMRDLETMQAAITAAETGTSSSPRCTPPVPPPPSTVSSTPSRPTSGKCARSLGPGGCYLAAPPRPCRQARTCGRLRDHDHNPSIRSRIRDAKTFQIASDIQTGAKFGMITLDTHLLNLYQAGKIHYEDLITKSQDPDAVVEKLKEMSGGKR